MTLSWRDLRDIDDRASISRPLLRLLGENNICITVTLGMDDTTSTPIWQFIISCLATVADAFQDRFAAARGFYGVLLLCWAPYCRGNAFDIVAPIFEKFIRAVVRASLRCRDIPSTINSWMISTSDDPIWRSRRGRGGTVR